MVVVMLGAVVNFSRLGGSISRILKDNYASVIAAQEMKETLERVRPITIGQASRLPGVTPAALSLVHVSIKMQGAKRRATV